MRHRIYRTCGMAVILVCRFSVLADTTGTQTLASGQELNISTGAVGSSGGGSTPSITAVLDAGSYSTSLAPGSVFVIKGTNLSPTGIGTNGALSTSYPLPQSSNGVSINFTPNSGGAMTQAYIVYLYNSGGVNQLAGILPSTVTPGNYNVTVANGGQTSSGVVVKVVAIKPGLVTRDSSGSGLAVIQNYNTTTAGYDIDSFTTGSVDGATISPAHPSQILVAWLTGMGAVPFADNSAPNNGQGYDFTKNGVTVLAYVGGVSIPAAFGGRTGCCAGEDEIVFTLPSTVITGCTVSFQVSVNGVLSQTTFISIATPGAAACDSPSYTTSQLQAFDNGTTAFSGTFSLYPERKRRLTRKFHRLRRGRGVQFRYGIRTSLHIIRLRFDHLRNLHRSADPAQPVEHSDHHGDQTGRWTDYTDRTQCIDAQRHGLAGDQQRL